MPQEAGINDRAVSFTKGCYVGQETVARLHYKGKPNRHMRGLKLTAPAQHGDPIVLGEKQVGTIGSVAESPTHGADRAGAGAARGRARRRGAGGRRARRGRGAAVRLTPPPRIGSPRWPISDSVGRRGGN